MTMKTITAILSALALIVLAPAANAEIASKAYVDDQDKLLLFGTTTPNPKYEEEFWDSGAVYGVMGGISERVGGVENALTHAVYVEQGGNNKRNALMVTNGSGIVSLATGGYLTDGNINPSANIQLGKMLLPTPGAACETRGCMLMYYNGQYVWEAISRETNETVSTTGAVSATVSGSNATVTSAYQTGS